MTDPSLVECSVRQLHARYVDAVWRKDAETFLDCFTEDGEWKIAGMHLRGHAEIRSQFDKFMAPCERILMSFGTPLLEVDHNTASSRTLVTECVKHRDGEVIRTVGLYYDRFVVQNDRWRFKWRHWSLYYYGPPDFSGPFLDSPEYGAPPGMPAPDEPTISRARHKE
ncbi:SnoaL-like domain [Mycolicibacterium flavescens]|uniref:YybH family protein n=1 Tax=Mycobacterium neumannii TaxID=2048551 RepID=UPI000F71C6F0|nr:nuclear transport factor 2 family protein [Mycobacterium neumannii]VEG43639.1 SnoaL-like domain [Mycolicibacterium flavescens]